MKYVTEFGKDLGPTIAEWTALKAKGELSERRSALLDDLQLLLADSKRIRLTLPDLTVADELVLHRGGREIHIRHLGKGNTDGDLVLWLPKERIVAAPCFRYHQGDQALTYHRHPPVERCRPIAPAVRRRKRRRE